MRMLKEILKEIEEMECPSQRIGCVLENECITDRYAAAAYGFTEAQKRIAEIVRGHMEDTGCLPPRQKAIGENYKQQIMGRFLRQE